MFRTNLILKIINKIAYLKAMRSSSNYVAYLRSRGVKVGNDTHIHQKSCLIDLTRPSLVTIGDNVLINDNFTLLTHDFVSGVFRELYNDFIPSSGAVTIGSNVRFGHNVTILKGVTIGDNCFIGAGSIVSSDIPANSVASGNPCKVISTIDRFYKYRQEASKNEAYLYVQSIVERYGRAPQPSDFWEEFPLFVDKRNVEQFPEIPIRHQLGTAYSNWLEHHHAAFNSFEEFVGYALKYKKEEDLKSISDDVEYSEKVLNEVRNIVSSAIGESLTDGDDDTNMNDVNGWDSLSNMLIISLLEEQYSIRISAEDMFRMTSVKNITKVISKLLVSLPISEFKGISTLTPHSKLWCGICKNVELFPNKVAVKMNGVSVTYAELYENVCRCATFLQEMGLKQQDKIILSAHKNVEYIYMYFASHILGVINVIVDAESNKERIAYIEQKIKPKLCLGYQSEQFTSYSFEELDIKRCKMLQVSSDTHCLSEEDIAEILFTTGTTGAPKGVCLSYANIYASATNINQYIQNTSDDIELLALPICHSFGMGRIRCNLLKGATLVVIGGFGNVQKIFESIEEEKITGLGFVPAAWAYIRKISGKNIQKYASQIKYIEIGSASMTIETKKELLEMFPQTRICMHYGLTEASRSAFQEFHDIPHLNSIGKPVTSDVDIKIYDKLGTEMPSNVSGEICVKGNMVLKKYLDEDNNDVAFWGDYFRTGDYGYKDEDGYIYISGREKEMINVGGKKVSPIEIEETIMSLGVGDCVCVGVTDDSYMLGEKIRCYILENSTKLSIGEISSEVATRLEKYKCPSEYMWISKIPYTESGKKQRIMLQEQLSC